MGQHCEHVITTIITRWPGNLMLITVYPLDEVEASFLFASYSLVLIVENHIAIEKTSSRLSLQLERNHSVHTL